ncbi:MAG: helix-turn-helix domain-containing protein [Butyricicoccus sp.]
MLPINMIMGEKKEQYFTGWFSADFPLSMDTTCFDGFSQRFYPWHWHKEIEFFAVDAGVICYRYSEGEYVIRAGEGGMINSNVLHSVVSGADSRTDRAFTFIVDAELLAGKAGNAIDVKYIQPLVRSKNLPFIRFRAGDPRVATIQTMRELIEQRPNGYEIKIRSLLSDIWMQTLEENKEHLQDSGGEREETQERMKQMLRCMQQRYAEKLTIRQIAQSANISERECQRCFRRSLGCTPVEYLTSIRVQQAALQLVQTQKSVLEIGLSCGFGSGSYFGKKFCDVMHCSPREYRNQYQQRSEKA